jgi:hypothetical protein
MKPMHHSLKRDLTILILSLCSTHLLAQVKFEKGYIIKSDGQRMECLIRNTDSRNTPQSFVYKQTEGANPATLTPGEAKEVVISGYSKFISATVKIDRSIDDETRINELTSTREPKWSSESLFLATVVEGKTSSLYIYQNHSFIRFFYRSANTPLEQLVYKPFRADENTYDYNRDYLNQLNANVKCEGQKGPARPDYRENDLRRWFTAYNACQGSPIAKIADPANSKRFSISLLAGTGYGKLNAENWSINSVTHFDSKFSPQFGVELEYTMPFDKNKWSIVLDAYNYSYKASGVDSLGTAQIDYSTISAYVGPRYQFFLTDDLRLFVEGMVNFEFRTGNNNYQWAISKPNNRYYQSYSLDIGTYDPSLALGAGLAYKNLSLDIRYLTIKEIFPGDLQAGSNFHRLSFLIKYRLFKF